MRRRDLAKGIAVSALTWSVALHAQQPQRVRRIGVLMSFSGPAAQAQMRAFLEMLTKLGWAEGSNLRIEVRWAAGDAEGIRSFAEELTNLRPDVLVAQSTPVALALANATRTIPIVFLNVADPIGSGLVKGLARPGGNLTGFTTDNSALGGKWVELLKEIAPRTVRVALLFNPATAVPLKVYLPSIHAAASSSAVEIITAPVHGKDEIEGVIAAQAHDPGGSVILMPDPFIRTNRDQILLISARYRLPTIYYNPAGYAESGGLIAYGSDFAEQFPQAATYVDRILKGAKPADLPVQAPTKFKLVINLKTAKALGLAIPPGIIAVADEVIE